MGKGFKLEVFYKINFDYLFYDRVGGSLILSKGSQNGRLCAIDEMPEPKDQPK